MADPIPTEGIISKIHSIRGKKVMLDKDLAELYEVETKALNQSVKRNRERFPADFMFRLTMKEFESLRSQFVTLEKGRGRHVKYLPHAFTEHGILMLSGVLNTARAIQVNIQIMRTFTKLRKMLSTYEDLKIKIDALERDYDRRFKIVFDALRQILVEEEQPKNRIGYRAD